MKKSVLLFLSLLFLISGSFAQSSTDKKFLISVSWAPKLYFDRISEKSRLIDYSLAGTSVIGEFSLNPRLSIFSGFQFDNKKNAEFIEITGDSPTNKYYSLSINRISSIPFGIKYTLTKPNKKISLYSKIGIKYTRVLHETRDWPFYYGTSGSSKGMDNILMTNLGIGSSYKISNSIAPFIEIEYAHSVLGSNSGVLILNTNFGLNISF